ncbi:MAG: flagellar protein FlaG [Syntrophomonadaceae bacterium]
MRVENQAVVEYPQMRQEAVRDIPSQPARPAESAVESRPRVKVDDLPMVRQKVDAEVLQEAVESVNRALEVSSYHLEFKVHEGSGRYQIKVVDSNSNEVLREIPPERILDLAADIRKMMDKILGLLVDETI